MSTTTAETRLALIPDHADRSERDLLFRLRQRARWRALARAIGATAQLLEDELFSLVVDRTITSATGAQLEQWGALIGEPRGALHEDGVYRRFVQARVLANRCTGSTDELIQIFELVTGPSTVLEVPLYPMHVWLQCVRNEQMDTDRVRRVVRMMQIAKPLGVGLTLVEAVTGDHESGASFGGVGRLLT